MVDNIPNPKLHTDFPVVVRPCRTKARDHVCDSLTPYVEYTRRQLLCSHGKCARRQMMISRDKVGLCCDRCAIWRVYPDATVMFSWPLCTMANDVVARRDIEVMLHRFK